MFKRPFKDRRCLLVATSYVEYALLAGRKVPVELIPNEGQPYYYAGLWDSWSGGGEPFVSCTMVTTEPNERIASFHTRMPVILNEEEALRWLDPSTSRNELLSLLRPYPSERIEIRNAELPPRQAAPKEPGEGQLAFDDL